MLVVLQKSGRIGREMYARVSGLNAAPANLQEIKTVICQVLRRLTVQGLRRKELPKGSPLIKAFKRRPVCSDST